MNSSEETAARFTQRLEAFSDLVFGFSLSLLATRLELPARAEDILNWSKGAALLVTFALICILWLQHYRIFRYHFVAHTPEVVLNFVFLFALALLPYALQTFIRFGTEPAAVCLYFGDLSTIFVSLATLQLRGLRQLRSALSDSRRLRAWRRTVVQYLAAVIMVCAMALIATGRTRALSVEWFGLVVLVLLVTVRGLIRRLPRFLQAQAAAKRPTPA